VGTLFIQLKALPLLPITLAWMLGLILARLDVIALQTCLVLLIFNIIALFYWRKSWLISCALGLGFGLCSVAWDVQQSHIPAQWLEQKINITATIDDVRDSKTYTRLRLSDVSKDSHSTAGNEALAGKIDVYLYRYHAPLQAGMRISALVKLHLPHNKQNPAYFDYAAYAMRQHIAAMGSVSGKIHIIHADVSLLEQMRQQVRLALAPIHADAQGILSALLLADRSAIPLAIDDAFAASGATHLLAISGLHVALVAGWGFMLCWWLSTRREDWIVRLPIRTLSLACGVLLAMGYATIAGWPIPAQRASLMLLAAAVAWAFRAKHVPLNSMLAALLIITLLDPASVLSVSLWLSFVATTSLLVWAGSAEQKAQSMLQRAWFWSKGMFWVSIIASLATLPLISLVFERFPVWSLLANALLVPLYALWVLPLALLGELLALCNLSDFATTIFHCSAIGITWGNHALLAIYDFPAGNLWLRADSVLYPALLGIFSLISGVLWLKKHHKSSFSLLSITLLLYSTIMLHERPTITPIFHVWDVGQGASALLQLPKFNLLVDVPGKKGSKFNGGSIAAENMRALGLLHIDAIVLTHAQSDHAGGALRLLASLQATHEIWLADVPDNHAYPTMLQAIQRVEKKGGKVRWLKQGDHIALPDGSHIDVLWPPQGYAPSNGNNTSLVLSITLPTGQRLLLAGDMQKKVERSITAGLQAYDVILIPHHGSKTSSTLPFVAATQPHIAIAQTGYRNHYGFPKKEVVKRYQAVGSEVWDTAYGAVSVHFSEHTLETRQFTAQQSGKRLAMQKLYIE